MVCDPLTIEDMLFHVQNQWTTSIYDLKNGVLFNNVLYICLPGVCTWCVTH